DSNSAFFHRAIKARKSKNAIFSYKNTDGHRGIRQGDPMSPYLFVLTMELLGLILKDKVDDGSFTLHHRCSDPQITHLAFADDLSVFMK
ncbi:hypothetical protein GIB67_043075, partial [Kingdonia uniflora]